MNDRRRETGAIVPSMKKCNQGMVAERVNVHMPILEGISSGVDLAVATL